MTTRHDAPKPIGPARAHESLSDPDRYYAGGCPYCRGLGRTGAEIAHAFETCERVAAGALEDPLLGMQTLEEASMRRHAAQRQRAVVRRIHDRLAADAREHVRQLLSTSANWNPWQPVRSGRYARNVALRQLAIRLARLTVATSAVWLAVAVWQAWH